MKDAFVTIVKNHNKRTEIFNGFSFIAHKVDGDFFFFFEDEDINVIKNLLEPYDRIFTTAITSGELIFFQKIYDKRWIIGGPITRLFSDQFFEKFLPKVNIFRGQFEEYLGLERDNIFTPYWNEWLSNAEQKGLLINPTIGYGASCGTNCYWGKCVFCKTTHSEMDTRNIKIVYSQLPIYDRTTLVHFRFGSMPSYELQDLIECVRQDNKNTIFRVYIRGDKDIKNVVEKAKRLDNILFLIGLETFSQTVSDKINKGIDIKTALEIIKIINEKGGMMEITMMSRFPYVNQKTLEESLENVKWIKENIRPNKRFWFYDSVEVLFPTEEISSKFGDYYVKYFDLGEQYFIQEKAIVNILSEKEIDYCSLPLNILENAGYRVIRRI